eukprot:363384-Chlamydomonas_euryale.AAC.8
MDACTFRATAASSLTSKCVVGRTASVKSNALASRAFSPLTVWVAVWRGMRCFCTQLYSLSVYEEQRKNGWMVAGRRWNSGRRAFCAACPPTRAHMLVCFRAANSGAPAGCAAFSPRLSIAPLSRIPQSAWQPAGPSSWSAQRMPDDALLEVGECLAPAPLAVLCRALEALTLGRRARCGSSARPRRRGMAWRCRRPASCSSKASCSARRAQAIAAAAAAQVVARGCWDGCDRCGRWCSPRPPRRGRGEAGAAGLFGSAPAACCCRAERFMLQAQDARGLLRDDVRLIHRCGSDGSREVQEGGRRGRRVRRGGWGTAGPTAGVRKEKEGRRRKREEQGRAGERGGASEVEEEMRSRAGSGTN